MPVWGVVLCLQIVTSRALVWRVSAVLREVGVTVESDLVTYLQQLLFKG